MKTLNFEKPIYDLYEKIEDLKRLSKEGQVELSEEIGRIEKRAEAVKREIYADLTATQILQIARHQNRPDTLSIIQLMTSRFLELHGDRLYRDDPAIVGGLAQIGSYRVVIIGHQKGHDTKENIRRNFGMPNPEGYRKAMRLMRLAEKFNLPIITLIDTKGAFPGKGAEERGQAEAIAKNLRDMSQLKVPIIAVVLGEGGSGGALGIGVANKLYMLEYAVYSVISPEGCASILFRDASKSDIAAEALNITAKDIVKLGVSDGIIQEPLGGAHQSWEQTAEAIKTVLLKDLDLYSKKIRSPSKIVRERYNKFRLMGAWEEV
ncbi:acetyl-CoA carboxylase carboxyltransferase subunit alpha [Thermoproteota archaeon]